MDESTRQVVAQVLCLMQRTTEWISASEARIVLGLAQQGVGAEAIARCVVARRG